MVELNEDEKEPLPGNQVRTPILQRLDNVITGVASYLKTGGKQLVHLRDPKGKSLGKVEYHVVIPTGRFVFTKLSDARTLKRAFKPLKIEPVIIRTDTTDEGLVASERETK